MDKLELEVRKAIVSDFGNRVKEAYSDPGDLAVLRHESEDAAIEALNQLVDSHSITLSDYLQVLDVLGQMLDESSTESSMIKPIMEIWMRDKEYLEDKCSPAFDLLRDEGFEPSQEMLSAYEGVLSSAQRRDNIVAYLVERAESEGIEKALSTESIHEAIREEYHTAREYVEAFNTHLNSTLNLVEISAKITASDNVESKAFPKILRRLSYITMKGIVKADIKAIYKT